MQIKHGKSAKMQNFDWDDIRVFLAIVEFGSVSEAAGELEINQSTVSRRITALEQQLGVSLFERARGSRWVLTAAGEQMRDSAALMQESANSISREVLRNNTEISGHVTITFMDHGTRSIGVPTMAQIAKDYPDLRLTMHISSDELDLSAREADVAIRLAENVPDNLVARKICSVSMGVYGNQEWYDRFKAGERNIPLITWYMEGRPTEWLQTLMPDSYVAYRANRPQAIQQMAKLGAGVAAISCFEGESQSDLVLFREFGIIKEKHLWVISHTDLRTTARVRIVRDRVIDALEAAKHQIEFELPETEGR
ncbi:MAG: LysR family transcriptional regulator [Pseudomonadota bacterium]